MKTKLLTRVFALLIDNLAIYALIVGIFINIGKDSYVSLSIGSLIFTIYIILSPTIFKGYHFGKYIMGMKIVKDNYENPSIANIVVRELSKIIYIIPIIGIIFAVTSNYMINIREDGKSIHDIVAKTKVIKV